MASGWINRASSSFCKNTKNEEKWKKNMLINYVRSIEEPICLKIDGLFCQLLPFVSSCWRRFSSNFQTCLLSFLFCQLAWKVRHWLTAASCNWLPKTNLHFEWCRKTGEKERKKKKERQVRKKKRGRRRLKRFTTSRQTKESKNPSTPAAAAAS